MYEIKKNLNDIFIHFIVKNVFKCDIYGLKFLHMWKNKGIGNSVCRVPRGKLMMPPG